MSNIDNVISDTNNDIDYKIKYKIAPTPDDKKKLQQRIKHLTKEQHLYLFNEIIKELDIYTVTENGIYFDLNDLDCEIFWKLQYQVNLNFDCINRKKYFSQLNQLEQNSISSNIVDNNDHIISHLSKNIFDHNGDFDIQSNDDESSCLEQDPRPFSDYDKLRISALSKCGYSTYFQGENNSKYTCTTTESKMIEKNIYTDCKKIHTKLNK